MKITVSNNLKGELILSVIKAKLKPGSVIDIPNEIAEHADVLWAKKKGYISFESDSKDDAHSESDSVEFVNSKTSSITISFLGRVLSSNQKFILKKSDKNFEHAMRLVKAGHLTTCDSVVSSIEKVASPQTKESIKPSRKSFKRKKSDKSTKTDDQIFDLMNTEVS